MTYLIIEWNGHLNKLSMWEINLTLSSMKFAKWMLCSYSKVGKISVKKPLSTTWETNKLMFLLATEIKESSKQYNNRYRYYSLMMLMDFNGFLKYHK